MPEHHAKYSPSQSTRWLNCPVSMYKHYQSGGSSPAAAKGTEAHSISEAILLGKPHEHLWKLNKDGPDHKDRLGIEAYVRVAEEYLLSKKNIGLSGVETKSTVASDLWGTVDLFAADYDGAAVLDAKFGYGLVSPEENSQLMVYALGKLIELRKGGILHPNWNNPDNWQYPVRLAISQPMVGEAHEDKYWDITAGDIIEWKNTTLLPTYKLLKEAERSEKARKALPFGPGEKQCEWCSFSGSCKPRAKWALQHAGVTFKQVIEGNVPKIDKTKLSIKELMSIRESAPLLKKIISGVDDELMSRRKLGGTLPGLKVVLSNKNRTYRDVGESVKALKNLVGEKAMKPGSIVGIGEAQKLIKEEHGKGECDQFVKDYIYKPEGVPVLAFEKDKRPEINVSADEVFAEYKS